MSTVTGVVERVNKNKGATNIALDGVWYGLGFDPIEVAVGDTVQFVCVPNGKYMNSQKGSFEVIAKAPEGGSAPSGGGAASGGGGGMTKDDYWKKREQRDVQVQSEIRYQAARNAAIQYLSVALDNEAVKLPVKQSDKLDAFEELLNITSAKFYHQVTEFCQDGE